MKTLVSVQQLRALAALAVVVFHALQWEGGGFEVGRAGVDLFFVISGVIMWWITADGSMRPGVFLWQRVTRVAPPYWLATLGVAGAALISRSFLPEILLGWRHLALSLAFIPHLDPMGRPFPLLPPGWSLPYEAAFYLIVAAAIPIPKPWRPVAMTAALIGIVVAGVFLADPVYTLGANPMLLEFAAGLWIGRRLEQGRLAGRAWAACLISLGLAALATLDLTGFIDELWRPLLWGAPAALIVAGALSLEAGGAVLRSRTLTRLGDASYATYLVHLPATAVVAHTLGYADPWLFIPAAMAASLGAGLIAHVWVERPLLRLARRCWPHVAKGRRAPVGEAPAPPAM